MKRLTALVFGLMCIFSASASVYFEPARQDVNPNPPDSTVRLIFIHHSTGENWLNDDNGGLARSLQKNNYYPSDTNYGWGPNAIGDRTDIPNWPEWFRSENTPQTMQAVFQEGEIHSPFARTLPDPGGENQIILFKSCFPNSALDGSPNDPPTPGSDLNVGNAKYIYNEILQYFKTRPDKLFVLITAPPLTDGTFAANARAFNQWLVNDWLRENNYTLPNVAVFDFYNVLTGPNNHHRFAGGQIEHVISDKRNTEYYPSEDDHPNRQGNQKATNEFLPMLNIFYNRWKASAPTTAAAQPPANNTQTQSAENQAQQPVQAPAGSAPAVGGLLFDFESEQPVWEASVDETAQTTALDCQINTANAGNGGQSMQIVFNVAANSWATCSSFFDAPRDLSSAAGIQFMLRLQEPPGEMHLDVFTGPDGERATYARQITLPETAGKWSIIQIRWSDFKRVEWEADGGTVFSHPEQITGLAFGFPAGDQVNHGILQIDDIQTFSSSTASAQAANPPAAPAVEQPAQAAPLKQETTGKNSSSGRLLPFCGSVLLVPLAATVALGRKKMYWKL